MTWLEIVAIVVLLMGVGAGGYLVAQRPAFWVGLAMALLQRAWPYLTRRMTPAQEQAWRECERRGGRWNHLKKRCE